MDSPVESVMSMDEVHEDAAAQNREDSLREAVRINKLDIPTVVYHYDRVRQLILDVGPSASAEDKRKRYRRLQFLLHEDKVRL